jgi:hypothetical protein
MKKIGIYNKERAYRRRPTHLDCELIVDNVNYPAFIENISNDGLFIRIAYISELINFTHNTKLKLKIQLSSGDTINLYCKEIWSDKNTPSSLMKVSGMKIINPPTKFKVFFKTLQ